MNTQWDAIVIGAGLGGLSAAATLARAGKHVLVLEQYTVPGGYAHGFRRGHFAFDVSLHSIDGISPGGWGYTALHSLGILDRVEFKRLNPFYVSRFPSREITAYADPAQYETELIRLFPEQATNIRSLFDELVAVFRETQRIRSDRSAGAPVTPNQMLERYPHLIRATRESWAECMDRHLSDPDLKAMISSQWGYFGLPPSRLNAAAFGMLWTSAHHYGAFYPRGGSMAVSRALEQIIKEHGGEIRYKQRVRQILVEGEQVVGVTTVDGTTEHADCVISNANAPDTLLKLVGREQLPPGYAARLETTPNSLASFNIYLGLDKQLQTEGQPFHELFVNDQYDIEAQYQAVLAGDWEHVPYLVVDYSGADPESAPPGCSVVVIMCLAPWDYQNVWGTGGDLTDYQNNPAYLEIREAVAETLLRRAEQHLPGLKQAIRYKEIATPLTNVRYTLNPGGAILGFEQSVEGMYLSRLESRTPFANLFLTGAWTNPGGGQSAALLSGQDVAALALQQLGQAMTTQADAEPEPAPEIHSDEFLEVNQPAPPFALTAIGSGREVSLQANENRPLVLIFQTQNTAGAAGAVNQAIRSRLPLASQVTVANVVALGSVPALFQPLIGKLLKRAYRQASATLPDGLDPADYVMIAPDWTGQVTKSFAVHGLDKAAAVVVIDRAGKVQGAYQGPQIADATVDTLRWL